MARSVLAPAVLALLATPALAEGEVDLRVMSFNVWYGGVQVSQPQLESYQRHLHGYRKANGHPLAVSGQAGRISAIKIFYRWLLKRHVILYNPADLLELPKPEKRLPAQVRSL